MPGKKELKYIQSLGHKKYRKETGCFIAEGPKIVAELIAFCPEQIVFICATASWINAHRHIAGNFELHEVSDHMLASASRLKEPNEVVAVLNQFPSTRPEMGFILYLDTIQDPGNMGTIIRTADWFGVKDIVCNTGTAEVYNPKVIQSTMASIARVNVYYDTEGDWLLQTQLPVYAAVLDGTPLYNMERKFSGVLIIGNESKGIDKDIVQLAKEKITIPGRGGAESLNAAVATGIILSHLLVN